MCDDAISVPIQICGTKMRRIESIKIDRSKTSLGIGSNSKLMRCVGQQENWSFVWTIL
jgi:hypothetical protein